jgi:uncharacterized protein YbcV (DUF1398 family)
MKKDSLWITQTKLKKIRYTLDMNTLYKDLNRENRLSYYWWRRNNDRVFIALALSVFILGFFILPALGLYIVN